MAKTRNAQDSTLINIRALKKRVELLEWHMKAVWKQLGGKPATPPEPRRR